MAGLRLSIEEWPALSGRSCHLSQPVWPAWLAQELVEDESEDESEAEEALGRSIVRMLLASGGECTRPNSLSVLGWFSRHAQSGMHF